MRKNSHPGDEQRDGAGGEKIQWTERYPVGVALQPVVQIIVGDGPRDGIGDQHGKGELPQQQSNHVPRARPEHFADADLLGAAFGGERREAEKAKSGDQDGDADKQSEHNPLCFVRLEQVVEGIA